VTDVEESKNRKTDANTGQEEKIWNRRTQTASSSPGVLFTLCVHLFSLYLHVQVN
jgi:hypothetical protein